MPLGALENTCSNQDWPTQKQIRPICHYLHPFSIISSNSKIVSHDNAINVCANWPIIFDKCTMHSKLFLVPYAPKKNFKSYVKKWTFADEINIEWRILWFVGVWIRIPIYIRWFHIKAITIRRWAENRRS